MRCLTSILLLLAFVGCSSSVTNNPDDSQHSLSALSSQNLLTSTQTPNDPLYSQQSYLNTTNVPQAWQVTTVRGNSYPLLPIPSDPGRGD